MQNFCRNNMNSINRKCTHQKTNNKSEFEGEQFVTNIVSAAQQNCNFRTVLLTGSHLQITLMNILCGEDIGIEQHTNTDQYIRVEDGQAVVQMGKSKDRLNFRKRLCKDMGVFVPAGIWHNIVNTGTCSLKLFSVYAPAEHPKGTIHKTKADAQEDEC